MKRALIVSTIFIVLLIEGYFSFLVAGQVTLEISTTTRVRAGSIEVGFKITNRGTEAAKDVFLLGQFLDQQQQVFIADRIGPGQSAESETQFEIPQGLYGSFPLFINVSYQHADGITVSSASLANVIIGTQGEKTGVKATISGEASSGAVILQLENKDLDVDRVIITGHAPDDLKIEPPVQEVRLLEGKGSATFKVSNISGNEGSSYGIFFAAEYDSKGLHNYASAETTLEVEDVSSFGSYGADTIKTWFYAVTLCFVVVLLLAIILSSRFRQLLFKKETVPHLLDICVLVAVEIFIFSQFDLSSLFTATTTTGGDTASHYYTLEYLRHTLLPAGKITGWTMANYAGFPILQFYFPLPFLIMCLLDLVMPLQVAFKLVTLSGTALLPVAAYTMLRLIRTPFPGPGIGAVLMLPFIFNSANSMWGGNLLSTLAGEFSYSLSMALSLILIGSLYRGAIEGKWVIRNAILVFLVGFSHGYTLLFAEAISLFLLITPYGFPRRALYLFKVYALGFCLLAFWLVPLLVFTKYTTSYHLVWTINSMKELVPDILLPGVITGIAGSFILLVMGIFRYRDNGPEVLVPLAYLWFGLGAAVIFFVAAPRIGVVDIRYVPYGQLMLCLMAALFFGWSAKNLLNRWGLNWLLLIVVTASAIHWTGSHVGPVSGWFMWNYEGFEAKRTWPVFERINKTLAGDFQDPRVVFEHSQDHNVFGSSRAFESLPLFAGRATLEGLYMQASISAPFVFYIQTLVSRESSQPFPQYSYTTMNFERARSYLSLFNVGDLVLRSREAKQAIRQEPDYAMTKSIGQYELWKLKGNSGRYVEVLANAPFLYQGNDPWKVVAHKWFTRDNLLDIHLVFDAGLKQHNDTPLKLTAKSLEELSRQEIDSSACTVKETIKEQEIFLETNCPGKPHLIKVSYHPNWHVEGAEKIYLVSPSFMLVYPKEKQVRLYYGPGSWDRLGQLLSFIGLLVLLLNIPLPGKEVRTGWSMVSNRLGLPALEDIRLPFDPSPFARRLTLLFILAGSVIAVAAASYHVYVDEPYRAYNRTIHYKDSGQYEKARAGFRNFMQTYPLANLSHESAYYIAITYYLEKNDQEALRSFEEYIKRYPQGNRVAEVYYHIGLTLLRNGKKEEGLSRMRLLIKKFPGSPWAAYAGERLQEHDLISGDGPGNLNRANLSQYMGRAIGFFNKDKLDEAKPILLEISERFPDFSGAPQALAALALCYYKEGNCRNTIKYYQKLIERYPGHALEAEAYFHLGICHERSGNNKLAENAFRKVLTIAPGGMYGEQARSKVSQ